MADNTTFTPGTGASASTDQLAGGEHAPHVKIMDGTDDSEVKLKVVAEDAAHTTGDTGLVAMAVRQDTAAALGGTDGDYMPLIVDSTGRLHIAKADLATIAGAVAGSEMQADVLTMPGTAAEDAALPAVAVVIAGDDGTDTRLIQLDANGYLKAVLQTGSAAVGKLAANSGVDIGVIDGTTLPAANLCQQAMAASLSVVPASDVTDATYIGDIKFGEALPAGTNAIGKLAANTGVDIGDVDILSIAAGENVVGLVGAPDIQVEITPTLDTGAHTAGDVLIAETELANAARVSGGITILHSVKVIDDDDQGAEIDIFFFDRTVTFGTKNSAPSISDADAAFYEGSITIASGDYEDLGGVKVATAKGIGLEMKSNATSIFVAAVTQGTPTHAATGLTLKFAFIRS